MLKNKSTHIVITFAIIFAVKGALAANTTPTTKPAIADYTRPLSFEPNRGQTGKQVDFLAHGTGYGLFLSHADALMVFQRGGTSVRMKPVGANASASAEPLESEPSKSNYFIGNVPQQWHTNVANYAKIRYRNAYPGIDLIYYGNQRQLEYDFVVSPGADPARILLDFQSSSKAEVDGTGNLVMHTSAGDLRWHKPIAYQEVNGARKLIACAYARKSGQGLKFRLAAYDGTKPLIIDPVLEYSTYLGGSGFKYSQAGDSGRAIAVDDNGDAYVTGQTPSADFPVKSCFLCYHKGIHAVFVTKFDSAGKLVYSTYLGGSQGGDGGNGIAVDSRGNAYVTGRTAAPNFPVKNAFQSKQPCPNCTNAFVTKLDAAGTALVYSTYLGGTGGDVGTAIAIDNSDNAYVTGVTGSHDFPTKNAVQRSNQATPNTNAFVAKLDAAGNSLVYSTYLGGSCCDYGSGIAVDSAGNAYVTGFTASQNFPTKNAFKGKIGNSTGNAFVTKFDAAGTALLYSTYLGGSTAIYPVVDRGTGIAVDLHGNAYVTGITASTDFPTKNAFQYQFKSCTTGAPSCTNAFVTKFDAAGTSLVYSTYLGGSSQDGAMGIAIDAEENAYVTGSAYSKDFPVKNAFQIHLRSVAGNAFVTKFDGAGNALIYSSFLGGCGVPGDFGNGIAVDRNGNAYVTGDTNSADFPLKNAFQNKLKEALGNAFVTKISAQ